MNAKIRNDQSKVKKRLPKQRNNRPSEKPKADQELCEELWKGVSQDDEARRLTDRARAEKQRLDLVRTIRPKHNQVAKLIRQHSTKCLFYPASGWDWRGPLSLFSAKCDLFVLTDWMSSQKAVLAQLHSLHTRRESAVQMYTTDVVELSVPRLPSGIIYTASYMPGELRPRQHPLHKTPFGWLADVEVTVGRRRRTVQLLYMNLEGVGVYWQYFAAQEVAPKYLCWRRAHGLGGDNWTEFHRWNQALGKAVDTGAQKPTYVCSDVNPGGGYDWSGR